MVAAARQQGHLRPGAMLGRRAAFQHRQSHAGAFEPFVAVGLGRTAAACEGGFHQVHALVETVAAEIDVRWILPDGFDPVAGADHVDPADRERIEAELARQLIHRRFHGERRLRRAVAAKAAARNHVGIDREACGLLVRAAIGRERAAERGRQRLAGMAAIGAGVGDHVQLDGGQRAVPPGAELDPGGHLVARAGTDELLLAGELPLHGPAGLQRGEHAKILRQHLLLAAETATDALGEHMQVARAQPEQVAELLLGDERRLRAGAHMQPPVRAGPRQRPVRLQVDMLHPRGRIGGLVDRVRGARSRRPRCRSRRGCRRRCCLSPRRPCHAGSVHRAPWRPPDRRRPAGVRSRPPAIGRRPRPRPRSRPRRPPPAGRRTARHCRGCRCRPGRPDGPRAWPCCRAGAGRPPR